MVATTTTVIDAAPAGIGMATPPAHLHRSFLSALTALRLCDPPRVSVLSADDYGGLIGLLADNTEDGHRPDADLLDTLLRHPWAAATIELLVRSGSVREAARVSDIHHKTIGSR